MNSMDANRANTFFIRKKSKITYEQFITYYHSRLKVERLVNKLNYLDEFAENLYNMDQEEYIKWLDVMSHTTIIFLLSECDLINEISKDSNNYMLVQQLYAIFYSRNSKISEVLKSFKNKLNYNDEKANKKIIYIYSKDLVKEDSELVKEVREKFDKELEKMPWIKGNEILETYACEIRFNIRKALFKEINRTSIPHKTITEADNGHYFMMSDIKKRDARRAYKKKFK